jgi:hypothetical protein
VVGEAKVITGGSAAGWKIGTGISSGAWLREAQQGVGRSEDIRVRETTDGMHLGCLTNQ